MLFEIDETERGNILLVHDEEKWINSWTRLPNGRWIQVSFRDCNYPAYNISTIKATEEELAAHIRKDFGGGCWTANKMNIDGVPTSKDNHVIGDPDD